MKKLIFTISFLTLTIIAGLQTLQTASAYQIDPSYRPQNAPFSLKEEITQQGAQSATIIILQTIAGALLYFAAPIAVIVIAMGGFNIVIYGAEQEKLEQGKKQLTWAIIGLFCVILSYSIVRIILEFVLRAV
ncbi:hypothetical protein A3B60_02210 [Candidatus Peregrinibacteria bacterium RIFCSPLOWO2_01_FULL_39_12]|nr:MAG: hypothetical protein A3B60_02210 [Candidatus Peregrinibacteria bacterium RIFCSPLOWO2_01_FULL_39_12]